jgi:hypothetical protein
LVTAFYKPKNGLLQMAESGFRDRRKRGICEQQGYPEAFFNFNGMKNQALRVV